MDVTITNNCFIANKQQKRSDQVWVNSWLGCEGSVKQQSLQKLKLQDVGKVVNEYFELINDLKALLDNLRKSGSEDVQINIFSAIKLKQERITSILMTLENPEFCSQTHIQLLNRLKKRKRQQKQRKLHVEMKVEMQKTKDKARAEIDSWQEKIRRKHMQEKQEKELQKEADSILGEVRRKKIEIKKLSQLLPTLEKLRRVRIEASARRGFSDVPQQQEQFSETIKHLESLVTKQMSHYEEEEKVLRSMLDAEHGKKGEMSVSSSTDYALYQWECAVFGSASNQPIHPFYSASNNSIDALVEVRKMWDSCISDSTDASAVPIGWVLPVAPSSEEWKNCLDGETQ